MNSATSRRIQVCLLNDNSFERTMAENWICSDDGFEVLCSTDCLESALKVIKEKKPDVVLLDYSFPGTSGAEAVRRTKVAISSGSVLVVADTRIQSVVFDALVAGADGFIDKEDLSEESLLNHIRAAREGKVLLERLRIECANPAMWNKLSVRERDVALLLKQGYPNKEISRELNISVRTVCTHIEHIFHKLDSHDRYDVRLKLWGMQASAQNKDLASESV